MKQIQNYINHVVFVIDESGSMNGLKDSVVDVFNGQIKFMAEKSVELGQETRVSVYKFADTTSCLIYDMDCMRLPDLRDYYNPNGNTALIDASLKSIEDLKKTAQLYGDHAFLFYVMTDGQENRSRNSRGALQSVFKDLPENWTIGILVPDKNGVSYAESCGFSPNNIQIWETSQAGIKAANQEIKTATTQYFTNRSLGIRGTKNLFKIDTAGLTRAECKRNLDHIKRCDYTFFPVDKTCEIRECVENVLGAGKYEKGKGFYQLIKTEEVQQYKQIAILDKRNNQLFGGDDARQLLGIPANKMVKLAPGNFGDFEIFVQSTSVNRKLQPGTKLLLMK